MYSTERECTGLQRVEDYPISLVYQRREIEK